MHSPAPTADVPFNLHATYQISQNTYQRNFSSTGIQYRFTVPTGLTVGFRAEVLYNFLTSDLSIALLSGSNVLQAQIGYNREEIPAITLTPGNYILKIYEPKQGENIRKCVQFEIRMAIQAYVPMAVEPACPALLLPSTFDYVPYLSNLTGNTLHFARQVLIDVVNRADVATFTLAVPSVVRIYIPRHDIVDVDVFLYRGIYPSGTTVASQYGYEDEIIHARLDAGSYSIRFFFSPIIGTPLPPPEDCASFPVIITSYPEADLQQTITASDCTSSATLPSGAITVNTQSSAYYNRSLATPLNNQLTFTVPANSYYGLWVSLRYPDEALGLSMQLTTANGDS